jgi:hypothetical protein
MCYAAPPVPAGGAWRYGAPPWRRAASDPFRYHCRAPFWSLVALEVADQLITEEIQRYPVGIAAGELQPSMVT